MKAQVTKFPGVMVAQVSGGWMTLSAKGGKYVVYAMAMMQSTFGGRLKDTYVMLNQDVRVAANWNGRWDARTNWMEQRVGERIVPKANEYLLRVHTEGRELLRLSR